MTLYLLCAPTTIEKDIWSALREKKDFQEKQWYMEKLEGEGAKKVLASANKRDTIDKPLQADLKGGL